MCELHLVAGVHIEMTKPGKQPLMMLNARCVSKGQLKENELRP